MRTFSERLSGSGSKSGEPRGPNGFGRFGGGCDMARGLVSVVAKIYCENLRCFFGARSLARANLSHLGVNMGVGIPSLNYTCHDT